MLKIYISLGLALLIIGLFAVVQDKDVSTYRVWSLVEVVGARTVADTDSGSDRAWDLQIAGRHGDACAIAMRSEISRYPNNIDVQLFREIPSTANCDGDEALFDTRLALSPNIMDGQPPYLIVNDQVWEIAYPDADDADNLPEFHELSLVPVQVEAGSVSTRETEPPLQQLHILGNQGVGCKLPLVYALRRSTEGVLIGVYNAIAADAVCPMMLLPFDEIVALPATETQSDPLIKVNAIPIDELEKQVMSQIDKVLTNILKVTVNVIRAEPTQVSLDVTGEHPDGCDYPVLVNQTRQGNTITIEVFREVPADVFCPMILKPYQDSIPLSGSFASGKYIINVNTHTQALEL